MQKLVLWIMLTASLFVQCIAQEIMQNEQTFIVSFGVHNGPPFAFIENNELVGGVIKDISDEIANELNIIVSYVKVPRKRQESYLRKGTIHAIMVSNPKWLKNTDGVQWSKPIFNDQDVLVFKHSDKTYQGLADVMKMRVGTLRGYTYPNMDQYFASGELLRSDVGNIELNFIRLEKGWVDTFVGSNLLIQHVLKNMAKPEEFDVSSFSVSEHSIYTALSSNSLVSAEQFNQVLEKFKRQGIIDAILKKYKINNETTINDQSEK